MSMKLNVNISTIWTMLAGTVLAVVYMFNTFATAAEVSEGFRLINIRFDKTSYRLIKSSLRDLRKELRDSTLSNEARNFYELDIEELIDDLCLIQPEDRECKTDGHI